MIDLCIIKVAILDSLFFWKPYKWTIAYAAKFYTETKIDCPELSVISFGSINLLCQLGVLKTKVSVHDE